MGNCHDCGANISADDQFCGGCGQRVNTPDNHSDVVDSQSESNLATPWPNPSLTIFAVVGTVMVIAAAAYYFLIPKETEETVLTDLDAEIMAAKPQADATTTAQETDGAATVPEAEAVAADAAKTVINKPEPTQIESGPIESGPIESGRWRFITKFVNVEKANPNDNSFELRQRGIGQAAENTRCISPEMADRPSQYAFPMKRELTCSASSFSMKGGDYRASVSCASSTPKNFEITGTYSRTTINLRVKYILPAEMENPGIGPPPNLIMTNQIIGEHVGACR